MNQVTDLTGRRFGRLTVLRQEGWYVSAYGGGRRPTWLCRCDCGRETVAIGTNLTSGNTRSCGCIRAEQIAEVGRRRRKKPITEA